MADSAIFTAEQARRLAGVSEKQLRHWARSDFYKPEFFDASGGPFSHVYSFRDVVSLRTIGVLRNKHKLPMKGLRRAGLWLSERHDAPWSSLRFQVDDSRCLYYIDPETRQPVALTGPLGQQALPGLVKLENVAAAVRRSVAAMRTRKARDAGRMTKSRAIASNTLVAAGTRIPIATIVQFHRAGYSADQIIAEFPRLTHKDIKAAVAHDQKHDRAAS